MKSAMVLLSGGQDSSSALLWALRHCHKGDVRAINISYGQRHSIEIQSAEKICNYLNVPLQKIEFPVLKQLGGSALVNPNQNINRQHEINLDLPASFVPGRNVFFLTIAAAYAYQARIPNLVTGVCQTDYSGYPDCRDNFIKSLQVSLSLAMEFDFIIHTPLMFLTKAESIELAAKTAPADWEHILSLSHTCYEGLYPPCGNCPACKIRIKGFQELGLVDPLIERAQNEGVL